MDPELDEPITSLGFVRSLLVSPGGNVKVHLRLPTSFCSPNFAYLMASDAKDVLSKLDWTRRVVVELDDHHDSEIINAGLAADAGYRGTFGHEAQESLDELRETFRRKAHTAAMERCLTALLRADPQRPESSLGDVRLGDLPDDATTEALLRRRRCPRIIHGARRFGDGGSPGLWLRPRRRAAGAAAGTFDTNLHRRQRPLLPRFVAHPLRGIRRQDLHPTEHPDDERRSTPMSTMRAVQVVGYHQNLEMKEVPVPTPTGPFDVVVKIGGAGVCRTDLHILEGQWAEKSQVQLPYTIGHENAGWVHAVGSAVTNVREGDKVIVHPLITCGLCRACRSGDDVHCEANAFPGIDTNGGYADYLKTSARSVVKIDDALEPVRCRGAGRRRPDRLPRGGQGGAAADSARQVRHHRRGRLGPHRNPGAQGPLPCRADRRRPQSRRAQARRGDRRRPRRGGRRHPGGSGARADRRERRRDRRRLRRRRRSHRRRCGDAAPRGRLPRRRLRREHRRADDRHRLDRDQLHRQPGRVLQRPVRSDGARRPRGGEPAHAEVRSSTTSSPPSPISTTAMSAAEPS